MGAGGRAVLGIGLLLLGACGPASSSVDDTPTPVTSPMSRERAEAICRARDRTQLYPDGVDLRYLGVAGGPAHITWLRESASSFEEEHDVTVGALTANLYSAPVPGDLVDRIDGEPSPDVVTAFVGGRLRACAARGLLAPLDELWDQRGWADALPASVVALATEGEHRYWAPTTVQWNPVFYRRDLFAALDLQPPSSWEELLTLCDAFREDGRAAFTSSGAWSPPTARYFTILNLRLNGATFHEEILRGEQSWSDDRLGPVFDHWEEMIDRGCFVEDVAGNSFRQAVDDLETGAAAMWNIGEWLHEFLDEDLHDELDFFTFPVLDPDVPPAEIALVQGVAVHAGSTEPESARRLAAFLTSEERLVEQFDALHRVAVDPRVPIDYDGVRARAHEVLEATTHLVQLLEFTAEPLYANAVLTGLVRFSRDPAVRADVLADLEAARLERFPSAPAAER